MCGFVAVVSTTGEPVGAQPLTSMTGLLAHRGPDGAGTFREGSFGLGFRRLAILDLAATGEQPMVSADGRHVIVFNGAIYNFVELRAQLQALGHVFRSTGDTEVLLEAWREWGRDCLARLNGMWAFIVYDRQERRCFGARDRFGVKPLFWYRGASSLVFASEIKAIRAGSAAPLAPDRESLASFLIEGVLDASPRTFYEGVSRVPAGTCFEVDAAGRIEWHQWWSLRQAAAAVEPVADPVAAYAELFEDAVRLRLRSDVPVGVLLSGGLDSTSIFCGMARQGALPGTRPPDLSALCYMDPEFDETPFIEATLEQAGGGLRRLQTSPQLLWSTIEQHLWHQDEPVHSFNSVVVFHLMKLAHDSGIKVVLNGQGADEVLAGYPNYFMDKWVELLRAGLGVSAWREVSAFARAQGSPPLQNYLAAVRVCIQQLRQQIPFYESLTRTLKRNRADGRGWLHPELKAQWQPMPRNPRRTLNEALQGSMEQAHLPIYLRTEDRNSMAHGVEVRLPFLDHRLVSFAFSLGAQWKIRGAVTKYLLREAMRERIPEVVRSRRHKFGFPVGSDGWFRDALYEPLRDFLASRAVRESGIWNVPQVVADLERHRRGEVKLGSQLFDVVQVSMWMQGFQKRDVTA
jgi:asparagine synthase (glutamine-hydrolysing)